jgi:dTDP-4-amino-4,6-dideoxygalactose transaminase
MERRNNIPFSPPDLSEMEVEEVVDTLRGTWITTGPKTKKFEEEISKLCGTKKTVCLNSATAALELILRVLGIGEGDEVIVPAYTYTASASPVYHVGAKIVLCDTQKDSFEMDYDKLGSLINEKTKAVIAVDIAGIICDYDKIFGIVNNKKDIFKPSNDLQKKYGRVLVIDDCAHGIGAIRNNIHSGNIADFTSFSFHAVKNLTTAEGGAATWKNYDFLDDEALYKEFQLLSLHGQNKDALHKEGVGNWEYDIVGLYYKCNMTDIMASIGLAQMKRYDGLINRRHEIIEKYNKAFSKLPVKLLNHCDKNHRSSGHLYLVRINGIDKDIRNKIIVRMGEYGIVTNVHYKPLPLLTAYKNLGFDIKDYPNAYNFYQNEISLPLYSKLSDDDVNYIIDCFIKVLGEFNIC